MLLTGPLLRRSSSLLRGVCRVVGAVVAAEGAKRVTGETRARVDLRNEGGGESGEARRLRREVWADIIVKTYPGETLVLFF